MSLTQMKKQLGEFCKTQQCETCTLCQFECTHDGKDFHIPDDQLVRAYKTVFSGSSSPSIKDSGERRQFDTGAVRDIQKGKGRCDLMPLDVIAEYYQREFPGDPTGMIFAEINSFTKTGVIDHLYEVLSKREPHDCASHMFLEVSKHFEEGAEKYGENNWQKGLPVNCYINSAVRHYLKWLRNDEDEPHDRAFCWNIMCAIWTCKHKPELNCYPITTAMED